MASSNDPAQEIGRLQATFQDHPISEHAAQWNTLWKESYTPWDRGGPSMALNDFLQEYRDKVLPPRPAGVTARPKALVPGCGRGYDALLLTAFGYDVVGVDVSEESLQKAAENEKKMSRHAVYNARDERGVVPGRGIVKWLNLDFLDGEDKTLEAGSFDLIFDYTFFCALPPEARPQWAKRMSDLLKPNQGRLVCLEWPLDKGLSEGGPPWGLSGSIYEAHLSVPGVAVEYRPDSNGLRPEPIENPTRGYLECLCRIQPARTHRAGCDEDGKVKDFISVWVHGDGRHLASQSPSPSAAPPSARREAGGESPLDQPA